MALLAAVAAAVAKARWSNLLRGNRMQRNAVAAPAWQTLCPGNPPPRKQERSQRQPLAPRKAAAAVVSELARSLKVIWNMLSSTGGKTVNRLKDACVAFLRAIPAHLRRLQGCPASLAVRPLGLSPGQPIWVALGPWGAAFAHGIAPHCQPRAAPYTGDSSKKWGSSANTGNSMPKIQRCGRATRRASVNLRCSSGARVREGLQISRA